MADFTLDEDQQQIQDMMRKFAQNELREAARECDEKYELPDDILNADSGPVIISNEISEIPLDEYLDTAEERYLVSLLRKYNGNKQELMKISGISRAKLYRKLSKYKIK